MSGKIYIDPVDGKEFTSRKLAKKHMTERGHKGGIVVEFKEDKKPMVQTTPATNLPKKGRYMCPICNKKSGSLKGIQEHMRAKGHEGQPKLVEKKKSKTKETVEIVEEAIETPLKLEKAYMKIRQEDGIKIQNELNEEMALYQSPLKDGYILQYSNLTTGYLDDLKWKYDFVEIEMSNADVISCLKLLDPNNDLGIYDGAGLKNYGIKEIIDDKIVVDLDEAVKQNAGQIVLEMEKFNPSILACVGGVWKKVYTPPATRVTTPKPITPKPIQKQLPQKTNNVQVNVEDFDDWDVMQFASEEDYSMGGRFGGGNMGAFPRASNYQPKPVEPPKPIDYPVFGVTERNLVIDRVFKYENYY